MWKNASCSPNIRITLLSFFFVICCLEEDDVPAADSSIFSTCLRHGLANGHIHWLQLAWLQSWFITNLMKRGECSLSRKPTDINGKAFPLSSNPGPSYWIYFNICLSNHTFDNRDDYKTSANVSVPVDNLVLVKEGGSSTEVVHQLHY